jgi:type VI secretion system protein ImpA
MNMKMGGANILDMSALDREVGQMLKFYNSCMADVSPAEGENETDETAPATNSGSAASVFTDPALLSYKVTSRAQAVLMLKKGAEYFQTQEPNSPIPILISRALRFSEMSFIELIEDIMPDALPRGRDILGIKPESKGASA